MGPLDGLRNAFGAEVQAEPVVDDARMGRRITGLDLSDDLTPGQASA